MDIFCIRGGTPLHGRIALHGAKNAALPLLAATLATGARCELLDCPDISDVTAACAILRCKEQRQILLGVRQTPARRQVRQLRLCTCRPGQPAQVLPRVRQALWGLRGV